MKDTGYEIEIKQKEVFFAKSPGQRLKICLEMTDFARALAEGGIRNENPDIEEINLKIEVFKRFYKDDFTAKEIKKIVSWLSK